MPDCRKPTTFLVAVAALALTLGAPASAGEVVELDEAEVFIEWNSTDTDFGIQFFWDSDGFTKMTVSNDSGKKVLDVGTRKNVREQGLSEGFFESVEPPADEFSMEEFFARFPEGDYTFRGRGIEGERLQAETEFTHALPTPPVNLSPPAGALVSHQGFLASFDHMEVDTHGNPLPVEFYVVVVEKEDDDPILQVYEVILRPGQTSVWVPEEFLEPDTDYKLEVIAQEESGNRTITETEDSFTTDAP